MASPASNLRSSSSALALFLLLICLNLIVPRAAHRDDSDRFAARGDRRDPVFAINHPDHAPARFGLAARVDLDRVVVVPQRPGGLEIDPVLGEVRRALRRIEFEGQAAIYGSSGIKTIP